MPVQHSVLRHHAYAWCPHHLIPVRGIRYFGTMLTHGVLTTLFPFTRHPLRDGEYFANNLYQLLGSPEFSTSAPCLRMVASPPYSRLPAIRSGWRVLRQQLTLLGSPEFSTSAPCSRMVSSPSALRQQLTLLGSPEFSTSAPAYAGVLTVGTSPTTYVVELT